MTTKRTAPADVPNPVYDYTGNWSGLYVDHRDGLYQVRKYEAPGFTRTALMPLDAIKSWLRNHRATCPDLP